MLFFKHTKAQLSQQRHIVKPWSKSESKPLSKQAPKKRKKEGFGPWADTKITWAIHPPHPQLLSMKECSGNKVQKIKVAQNDPPDSPS